MKTEIIKIDSARDRGTLCKENTLNLSVKSTEEAAEAAGAVLRRGGTVAFPTDTVYGLGAVFSDRDAVRSIFEAKGRPENKPLSILVSGIDQVHFLTDSISEDALKLMKKFWP